MKRILLAIIFFSNYCLAQLPSGAEAPNFTFTDLNNQSHELYSYLDSGKTVFLDILLLGAVLVGISHLQEHLKSYMMILAPMVQMSLLYYH